MAAGGGAVGAIIAAKQLRVQRVVDAFRLADATAPDRARRLEDLGLVDGNETRDLIVEAVLLPGPRDGTYYLSEAGMIYRRDDRKGLKALIIVMLVVLAIGALFLSRMTPS
jgi:hypothetical protein